MVVFVFSEMVYHVWMKQSVIVIHGIAMRSRAKVRRMIDRLATGVGGNYEFISAYWGDLGGDAEHVHDVLARYPDSSDDFSEMVSDWFTSLRVDKPVRERVESKRRARAYRHEQFNRTRLMLTTAMLPVLTDTIVYQSAARRELIQARIREVIRERLGPKAGTADEPLTVIGHSLGGVIAFDLAVLAPEDNPLHYRNFITMGSQPGLFHVLDSRQGVLKPYRGYPVKLPSTIQRWTNIWDQWDLLAFGTDQVFRLHDDTTPRDVGVKCHKTWLTGSAFMQSHTAYWDKRPAARAVREALRIKASV